MSEIAATVVMELRRRTGAGVVQCRDALRQTAGDINAAVKHLRAESRERAGAKMGHEAGEGGIALAVDGLRGALIEINSETDFAARTKEFLDLARVIAALALTHNGDLKSLLAMDYPGEGCSVAEQLREVAGGKIRENLRLRRCALLQAASGAVVGYVHNKIDADIGRLAALVAVESSSTPESLANIGKQLAMHIAANDPRDVEEMARQDFVMNGKVTVAKAMEEASAEICADLRVSGFLRFALAEPIAEEESDL